MATTLQFRRDTTANLASVTGAVGELFVDTDKDTIVVMDGSTVGGFPLSRETTTQSAFDQANTGVNNAASASAYANTGITLAQAAFDQANTGGGGGADLSQVSEDILPLFSEVYDLGSTDKRWYDGYFTNKLTLGGTEITANTINLPNFTDGQINVTGNVNTLNQVTLSTAGGSSITSWRIVHQHDANGETVQIYQNTTEATEPTGTIPDFANSFPAGDTLTVVIDGTTHTVVLPAAFTYTNTSDGFGGRFHIYGVLLDPNPYSGPGSITYFTNNNIMSGEMYDATASYGLNIQTDYSYTFSQTGEFISDSALVGDVLIVDDIITPVTLDSYGLIDSNATGTLTVNGNLNVTGNTTGIVNFGASIVPYTTNGNLSDLDNFAALAAGKILEPNKKYIIFIPPGVGSALTYAHVVLPDTTNFQGGETIEIYYNGQSGGDSADLYVWTHSPYNTVIDQPTYVNFEYAFYNVTGGASQINFAYYAKFIRYGMKATFLALKFSNGNVGWQLIY
jgi:hypothetical protein